jgi:hypothetical protein
MIGTTIFLAGGEASTLIKSLLDGGVRNVLFSYFYIWELRRENAIARIQKENPHVNWFLDSGAFTYMQRYQRNPESLPPLETYVRRYFSYIDEYGDPYCRITELDVDTSGHPLEEVDEWREHMLERWPHLNITPVWHESRGAGEWDRYCADPRIRTLAIGSDAGDDKLGYLRRLVMDARVVGKPVHGFGQTKTKVLTKVPFDSVDSSSWSFGQRTGITFIFRANKFLVLAANKKYLRANFKSYFTNIGCDAKLVVNDDVKEVRKANIIAWRAYADRLDYIKRVFGQNEGLHPDYLINTVQPPGYQDVTSSWRRAGYDRKAKHPTVNTEAREVQSIGPSPRDGETFAPKRRE